MANTLHTPTPEHRATAPPISGPPVYAELIMIMGLGWFGLGCVG